MNWNQTFKVIGGVFLFLVFFIGLLFGIEYLLTKHDAIKDTKQNTQITSPWTKSVEKRFRKNDAEHKIMREQLDNQADSISSQRSEINELRKKVEQKTEIPEIKNEQKKETKVPPAHKRFPQNY